MLSGVILAEVNSQPATASSIDWGTGLLTAEEVAGMDVSGCEVAVLSACETGVGRVTGGEGVLGLQRAFHVAGAEFVIASLWRIEDDATRKLMSLFYKNLWIGKLSPPDAMRQAQLSMPQGNSEPGELRGHGRLAPSEARAGRGAVARRQHPRIWAAWVVSGVPNASAPEIPAPNAPAAGETTPSVLADQKAMRPAQSGELARPHSIPPGWRGGKIEPFLAAAFDPDARAVFTTSADGKLHQYAYPDFTPSGAHTLAGPAYQAAVDSRRGLLFAIVARPGALKVGRPAERPGGIGDVHVYDLKPAREGRSKPENTWAPMAVLPLGADVPQMLLSRDGRWLFVLTRPAAPGGAVRLVRMNTTENKFDLQITLPAGAEAMCLTPDGASLFVAVSTKYISP